MFVVSYILLSFVVVIVVVVGVVVVVVLVLVLVLVHVIVLVVAAVFVVVVVRSHFGSSHLAQDVLCEVLCFVANSDPASLLVVSSPQALGSAIFHPSLLLALLWQR